MGVASVVCAWAPHSMAIMAGFRRVLHTRAGVIQEHGACSINHGTLLLAIRTAQSSWLQDHAHHGHKHVHDSRVSSVGIECEGECGCVCFGLTFRRLHVSEAAAAGRHARCHLKLHCLLLRNTVHFCTLRRRSARHAAAQRVAVDAAAGAQCNLYSVHATGCPTGALAAQHGDSPSGRCCQQPSPVPAFTFGCSAFATSTASLQEKGADIYRSKGILNIAGTDDK